MCFIRSCLFPVIREICSTSFGYQIVIREWNRGNKNKGQAPGYALLGAQGFYWVDFGGAGGWNC
jgi:hypothetical protein